MITAEQSTCSFMSDGGEMGALTRAYDWESSPLGKPALWPQGLKTAVRLLLSSGHPMFIWWGPELIQFYNDAYRRSLGPERHPCALGQYGNECWAEIWDIIGPQIEQVMSGAGPTWHENQLVPITRGGRREDVYWTYSYNPIDDPTTATGIGGVLVITTETTAQVLAEQEMKAAEARWRELFNQAPGFVCLLSGPEHIFEFANPRYFELVGTRAIIGKAVGDVLPELVEQDYGKLLDQVYQSGKAHNGFATPITLARPDGSVQQRYLDFVYQPIVNVAGEVTGIFVDGYDVTERVRSAEILREEDKRKDEFLAMLAHELRNPLAPIRNASELLSQTSAPDSNAHAIGELVTRQVTQLTHLVDDLLDVSRITQSLIELQREPLDLHRVVTMAIESSQTIVLAKNHEIIYSKKGASIYVNGDLTRLVQCVANILNNAAKYTDEGGCIKIDLREDGAMAAIEVTDNGIGISPEVIPDVFELFVQADRALDRSQGGLGIGLSIVRRLVQMHGGNIKASSQGPGQGSTFTIFLPMIAAPLAITNRPEATEISPADIGGGR